MPLRLTTYYQEKDIPDGLPGENTFHSKELFRIYESTPGYIPLLIVASDDGVPVARLLAAIRKTKKWLPSCLSRQCVVYGTGELLTPSSLSLQTKEHIFGELLEHLVKEASRTCLVIEFRNLENAMFGYRLFRANDFFPVNWLRVRNSLHSMKKIEERFSPSRIRQVKKGIRNGAVASEAHTEEEIKAFSNMISRIYSSHLRRYLPDRVFFNHLNNSLIEGKRGKIFIVKYKDKVIGGSVCIYSGENAYLWFSGGMRKTYAMQYPGILAVWKAMEDAHRCGYRHIEFMDVGLPFRKHGYREFVLRFGGKQSSTRRWFRINWNWLNKLLIKIYV